MSRARSLLRASGAVVLAATAACSFTVGFDGFVGDPLTEGGVTGRDDAAASPGDEPSRGDAGSTSDGGPDDAATPDPNVPPRFVDGGSYCSDGGATSTFCEDFDTRDLPARWLREGTFARLTSYAPKSAPNVFLVDVPPTESGGTFVSKISRDFGEAATDLLLEFDIKPERVNLGSSFFILAALEWSRGDDKYSLRFVYANGNVRLEESNLVPPPNNKDAYHPFFTLPVGEWTRVALDVTASGPSPGASVSLDGVPVGQREPLTPTPNLDPRPTLILGAVFAGNPHTGWTLRYDDVSLRLR